nr:efflux RND transporter permease subunit [Allgaiera sp.]
AVDPALLPAAAQQVAAKLRTMPDAIDVDDGLPLPGVDWELQGDRAQAARYGITPGAIGAMVRMVTGGLKLSEFRPTGADDAVDITLRLPREQRTISELDQLRIATNAGPVPISNFVTRVAAPTVGTLTRIDGVRWTMAGADQDQKDAQAFLGKAFLAAMALIFAVLLAQFNRFISVGLVLSAVVMSTIGVFLGLMIMGQPFGVVMTGIGIIALAGVVVNNNIVLIDTYDQLRDGGMEKVAAILETCRERARPVVLTALTAILGVLPIAFGLNLELLGHETTYGAPSTQWWISLSSAIVFGLAFATVLTLIVTPSMLMLVSRDGPRKWRWFGWMRRRR